MSEPMPCYECQRECDEDSICWMVWLWYRERMEEIRKMLKTCPICGAEYEAEPYQRICPGCQIKSREEAREAYKQSIRKEKAQARKQTAKDGLSLAEFNRLQRERGLTYGGRPLGDASPAEPKFLEGVKKRWTKPESDSESQ